MKQPAEVRSPEARHEEDFPRPLGYIRGFRRVVGTLKPRIT